MDKKICEYYEGILRTEDAEYENKVMKRNLTVPAVRFTEKDILEAAKKTNSDKAIGNDGIVGSLYKDDKIGQPLRTIMARWMNSIEVPKH